MVQFELMMIDYDRMEPGMLSAKEYYCDWKYGNLKDEREMD